MCTLYKYVPLKENATRDDFSAISRRVFHGWTLLGNWTRNRTTETVNGEKCLDIAWVLCDCVCLVVGLCGTRANSIYTTQHVQPGRSDDDDDTARARAIVWDERRTFIKTDTSI